MMHDRQRPSRHHQLLLAEHFFALVRDRSVGEDLVVHLLGLLRPGGEHRPCRLQPGVAQRKVLLRLLARDRTDLVLGGAATQPVHAVVLPAWDDARRPHLDGGVAGVVEHNHMAGQRIAHSGLRVPVIGAVLPRRGVRQRAEHGGAESTEARSTLCQP